MLYFSLFLLLNIGYISDSYIMRPRDKIYSKRNLDIYPDLVRLEEEGAKQEVGAGPNCNTPKACGNSLAKSDPKIKASNIAQKAAQEAKAANDAQMGAADAAAAHVKSELADKAMQSARAAEAALAGKQQIVEQLESEHTEAQAVVQEVTASLQNTQTNAASANDAAVEARKQVDYLKRLVEATTSNLAQIENVSSGAQQELSEKSQILEAANHRVETLGHQLETARQDFEKTKKAAYRAACAAVEAKQKAQRNRRRIY